MTRLRNGACALSILALCVAAAPADELAAAEKQIVKNWQRLRSAKANITLAEGTEERGNKAASQGEGTLELLRKGDRLLLRQELKSTWEIAAGERKSVYESNVLTICDGKVQWELRDQVGLKTVVKSNPRPESGVDLEAFFDWLHSKHELKLLDEDSVGGLDAFVIQATPKRGGARRHWVYFFSKDHGVLLKKEQRNKSGDSVSTTTFTDFEFDVKIDPKRFEFDPPPGVIVQDKTRN